MSDRREPVMGKAPEASRGASARGPVVMQLLPALNAGGVERGAVDIAGAVVAAGGKSLVVSSGGRLVREAERVGAEHITLPVQSKSPAVMLRNVGRLAALIRAHQVEIVHARSRAPAWSGLFACRRTGAHFVTTFHGAYNQGPPLKKFYNSIMARGERVIAISEFIADHVAKTYKKNSDRIRIILRGIDLAQFDPEKVPAVRVIQLAEKWRLPDGVPVIMIVGRLTRLKGHELLVEALAKLGEKKMRCLIVGEEQGGSNYRRKLEQLVQRRGLDHVVHIVGACTDMPAAYMLADVVVSASIYPEAFGRVMAEAQAMGKPVVAPAHGASAELVIPNQTGWLSEPGDAESLTHALNEVLELDTAAREALAASAVRNVRSKFSKDIMCASTLEVYREILANSPAAQVHVAA
jgi:glycosyltransferase involved in cell wall biosynthesis